MAKKVRLTNFARFFIFLIIVVPLAYLGASYINDEDPKENINKLLDKEIFPTKDDKTSAPLPRQTDKQKDVEENTSSENMPALEDLRSDVNYYKSKVEELERKVKALEKENYKLKENK